MKPVLYLDVDGVLLTANSSNLNSYIADHGDPEEVVVGLAAPGAAAFINWATDNFEVRWLTSHATSGKMSPESARDIAGAIGVDESILLGIEGLPWYDRDANKVKGIALGEHKKGRRFFWVDDDRIDREQELLQTMGFSHYFILCEDERYPDALIRVWRRLVEAMDENKGTEDTDNPNGYFLE